MVYRCEWNRPKNIAVDAAYASVLTAFDEALGQSEWTIRRMPRTARFEPVNPRRNPVIEVRIVGSKASPVIEISLFPVDRWGEGL
jgi:hypothetical protein